MITGVALYDWKEVYFLSKPFRHNNLTKLLGEKGIKTTGIQGFITHTGEFMDRELAERHARSYSQLTVPLIGSVLTSEDLW